MLIDDEDPYGYDTEAVYRDADLEQAQWTAEANRLHALRNQGVCTHSSSVSLPDSGEIFYPEQEGLKPGEVACTEHTGGCTAVFPSQDAWFEAMQSV